jgi:hypothetical protein
MLITKNKATKPCAQLFWERKYGLNIDKTYWKMALSATQEERARLLQWKILHNIFPTNILLHKMKIKESNRCSYCEETDYLEHFFWKCIHLKDYWKKIEGIIYKLIGKRIAVTEEIVLFGYNLPFYDQKEVKEINYIILIAKICISKFKYGDGLDISYIFDYELGLRWRQGPYFLIQARRKVIRK